MRTGFDKTKEHPDYPGLYHIDYLSHLLGIARRTFSALVREGHIDRPNITAWYPLEKTIQQYCQYVRGLNAAPSDDQKIEAKVKQARLDKLTFEQKEREGQFIEREKARRLVSLVIRVADDAFASLADGVEAACSPGYDVLDAIQTLAGDASDDMHDYLRELVDGNEGKAKNQQKNRANGRA